jgi:hypothetical protein
MIGEGLDEANATSNRPDDTLVLLSPETAAQRMAQYCGLAGFAKQLFRHSIAGRKVTQRGN